MKICFPIVSFSAFMLQDTGGGGVFFFVRRRKNWRSRKKVDGLWKFDKTFTFILYITLCRLFVWFRILILRITIQRLIMSYLPVLMIALCCDRMIPVILYSPWKTGKRYSHAISVHVGGDEEESNSQFHYMRNVHVLAKS